MKMKPERFVLRLNASKARRETYLGREHIVVPMVGLVEGVIWSSNATAPALVLAEDLAVAPMGWNGRPVFINHPSVFTQLGTSNTPDLLQAESVGMLFNANSSADVLATKKLKFEAWLDVLKLSASATGQELIGRIEAGEKIEVSTGLLTLMENTSGTFNGKRYEGIWRNIIADHLAIIPVGQGACSVDMGCGIFANAAHEINAAGQPELISEEATVRTLAERVRSLIPFIRRDAVIEVNEAGDSDSDVRRMLEDALRAEVPGYFDLEAVYPDGVENSSITGPACVYSLFPPMGGGYETYQRGYSITDGKATLGDTIEKVRYRRTYEVVNAAGDPAAAVQQEPPKGCGCGQQQEGESEMNKTQRINALCAKIKTLKAEDLANVPDTVLAALEAQAEKPAGETTPPPQQPTSPEAPQTLQQPQQPTTEQPAQPAAQAASELAALVNTLKTTLGDPDLQAGIAVLKAQGANRKATTISLLKNSGRCTFTDEQLNAKSQEELDALVQLAGVAPKPYVNSFVDFGGLTAPRVNTGDDKIPAPPSLADKIAEVRGNTKKTTVQ
jgi:hypothetical protein